ncbi:tol-pal system protein YbgF [Pusillimonas sp. CC-YST705]|uniref:Cell division coordinator CpoB n=1 Tax=Mesopusillimonas faecipullorum TaxID=2755040 RepID=A0ABS8CBK0_9BURK|nr:tol-pal system protein YbgF [Mesopusillimonas faecipullorum]MCB5363398.1 tol-pal system protein YbgF [Mesopusillimonas faecipullorum]
MSFLPQATHRVFLTCATLAALLTAPLAHAFADDDARRAILELRQQVRQMTEQNQQARLSLAEQLENLQQELANLRGQVEHLRWEVDAKRRLEQEQIGVSITVNNPQEQAAFNQALTHFRGGKYKEAGEGFATFLAQYPNSQLASEAMFYQGSSQYANRQFDASIATLQRLTQGKPDDARTPDALLIIAANQVEKGNMGGAKTTLQSIVSKYPQSPAAATAQERIKLLQ